MFCCCDPLLANPPGLYVPFTVSNFGSAPQQSSLRLLSSDGETSGPDLSDIMGSLTCPNDCPAPSRGLFATVYCNDMPPDAVNCLSDSAASPCLLGVKPDCSPCPANAFCTFPRACALLCRGEN